MLFCGEKKTDKNKTQNTPHQLIPLHLSILLLTLLACPAFDPTKNKKRLFNHGINKQTLRLACLFTGPRVIGNQLVVLNATLLLLFLYMIGSQAYQF